MLKAEWPSTAAPPRRIGFDDLRLLRPQPLRPTKKFSSGRTTVRPGERIHPPNPCGPESAVNCSHRNFRPVTTVFRLSGGPMNIFPLITILTAGVGSLNIALAAAPASAAAFRPAVEWLDNTGVPINAHGGGVIFHEGRYYWYGEHKLPGRSEKEGAGGGVHCYSSTNLSDWQDEGIVLPTKTDDPTSDIAAGCILERPKVLFNRRTQQFVLFFKLYPRGTGYDTGYVGVATADTPTGRFTYRHKFLGAGSPKGSGDFALVEDVAGIVYHLTVRKPDKTFVAGALRDDYLFPAGDYFPVEGVERHTEAPAVMRVGGSFYLLGSGSSSWAPNAARSFVASAPTGPYRPLGNPVHGKNPHNGHGSETTFGGQISFLLPVAGKREKYIALFDLWKPERPIEGRYAWLPVELEDGRPVVSWRDRWDLRIFEVRPGPP